MVFSSITFLFFFLPTTLLLYYIVSPAKRNLILLAASLFFYAWGEGVYVLLMLASIVINYSAGRLITRHRGSSLCQIDFIVAILLNLSILVFFKYANFVTDNVNTLFALWGLPRIDLTPIRLPIGISFFTFQALSYVIDVYRGRAEYQKNIINLALYISLFPQLIAGPIIRYQDIAKEIIIRKICINDLSEGIQRFILGLSKKVLLANPLAVIVDHIFLLPQTELTLTLSWLGALCFTLQIYYDFSGYSDMAIGLGRMFGFHFLENFNYPYISKSIREFWRRWHISLSTWFRDYVYIPLGGGRKGNSRTYLNLVIVFLLCGLWHGAAWTFILWGFYHGFFIILERTRIGEFLRDCCSPFQTLVTMFIVVVGWVIFRCDSIGIAMDYLAVMFGYTQLATDTVLLSALLDNKISFEICVAIVLAFPIFPSLIKHGNCLLDRLRGPIFQIVSTATLSIKYIALIALLYFSIISLAAGVYNPFIYFRF